ncbi:OLC1v1014354C1 [Oldenlandia corymbosa var. corymbosa]|uniref:OLC1v1014354C1 n=1 Tax=Oldenlandia corymbosa var. corymbosa TaxID=529605 RepID=A0AAV1E2N6_OLDCO|nr:OLC1v1014354C1 [Oldenlandia corymbosa var. corymbosa]
MAVSKVYSSFLFLIVILTTIYVAAVAAAPPSTPGPPQLPCVQQLIPCQPFLKQTTTPPAACCIPMNELVKNSVDCLCQVINTPDILKTFNITQADAFHLANSCHANADPSMCNKNGTVSPGASPAVPLTPPGSTASNSSSHKSNDGVGVRSQFGVLSAMIDLFLFLIVSNMGIF